MNGSHWGEDAMRAQAARSLAKFWANITKIPGGCWVWNGAVVRGLPRGFHDGVYRHPRAIVWELTTGVPPEGRLQATCRDPFCVNPEHAAPSQLPESDVRAMRDAWRAGGITQEELAELYGTSRETVSRRIAALERKERSA